MLNVNLCFIFILRCILTLQILNQPVHTKPSSNRVKVNVSEGTLVGIVEESKYGDSYNAFRGIPYAKPPVGDLRFQDPQPPEPWSSDRDALSYGYDSIQVDMTYKVIGNEDCLYLNVYTNDMTTSKKSAVMVWINGGGFFVGDSTSALYGPDYIMRKDVVFVTLNYRLGVLGFLNLYTETATGNQGLKDVVMALKWIQRNILQFGGDPDNVTIFGQNAGGVIVHYLTISPLAKGLFHKAICQSGVTTVPWAFTERVDAINYGLMLAQKLGNATLDPEVALKFLKNIDGRKLIAAKIGLDMLLAFTPTVDYESSNPFLPEHPLQLLRNGIEIPIMFGYNSQEGNIFIGDIVDLVNNETLKEINYDFKNAIYPRVLRQLPQLGITVPELRSLYFGNKTVSEETIMALSDFIGDQHIYRGIIQAIDTQMNSTVNESTYLYKFSYESETSPVKKLFFQKPLSGTSHFEELGYLFYPHIGKKFGVLPFAHGTPDYKIMEYLTQMWTDFAKTGNPTPSSANFTWTPVKNGTTYDYLNINNEPQMKILIKGNQRWDWENRLKLSKEPSVAAPSNRVNVSEGTLVGIVEESVYGNSYNAFRGIPYAKPPVGDLRFRDPQPPEPWSSDRDASYDGNICLQMQMKYLVIVGKEDCLYLNVYTNDVTPSKKSAVMVWIHGGGFVIGAGTSFYYGPDYIMRKDVVLVTLNYRLGVLGFLNFYKEMATGNQGLKDVVMALKWVRKNILQFGGDPDNVTIFGQDAGGVMVHYLTITPLAEGLFHKAICQSGVITVPWAFTERDDAINNGLMLAQKLGNATSDPTEALKFLKDIDGRELIAAETGLDIFPAFTPTVDSESSNLLLSENPLQLLRNGIKIPIMFGYNSQEGNIFISDIVGRVNTETLKKFNSNFKKAIYPRVLRQLPQLVITVPELRSLYFGNKTVSEETIMALSDFIGDQHIYRGIVQAIDIQMNSNVNQSTYLYKFSYESETSPVKKMFFQKPLSGTSHFEELGYLFYPHIEKNVRILIAHGTLDYKIMEYLTQMWTDFAKTGNPTPFSANFTWTPVKSERTYDYLDINNELQMKILINGHQRWDWENRIKLSKEPSSNKVKVKVSEGTLVGIVEESVYGDSYNAFRGIPYAKPPVGNLRFRDPKPPEPWSSDRDALFHGDVCLQMDIEFHTVIGTEDCLYLNVYTNNLTPSKRRSVMVWIHGGGFFMGDGTSVYYGPDYIMRKDVVLVTLNYRLGVLGFLNFYTKMATGNQGLKDVVMALRWVRRNILQFGGDPDNVAIFGQNAGGVMVHYLTISPLAKDLFHKAICQSGVATVPWAFTERDDAINNGLMLAQKLGNVTSDPDVALKFLKDIDGSKLIETKTGLDILLAFTPTVDSKSSNPFLPKNPLQLLRNGTKIPIIFGYNSQEGNFFISANQVNSETFKEINSDFKKAIYPRVLHELPQLGITLPKLRSLYFSNNVSEKTIMALSDFIGDQHIYRGIIKAIDIQMNSNVNQSTYLYEFSYESETSPVKKMFFERPLPGTSHFEELGYLFCPLIGQFIDVLPFAHNTSDYNIMEYLTQMWTDFAKTGNPTPSSANFTWIPVKRGITYDYLNIDNEFQMKILINGHQRWDWKNKVKLLNEYTKSKQFSGTEPFGNYTKHISTDL